MAPPSSPRGRRRRRWRFAAWAALALVGSAGTSPALAGGVRYSGELSAGWAFTDCPELGRAGLAIVSCDRQRPDHALSTAGRGRLDIDLAPAWRVSLEEDLRLTAPRTHGALATLAATSTLGTEVEPVDTLLLSARLVLGHHFEPDPRWQSIRAAFAAGARWFAPGAVLVEGSLEAERIAFATDFPKNSYGLIDASLLRASVRLKRWLTAHLRASVAADAGTARWRTNVGGLLADLVDLDGRPRVDRLLGAEGEIAFRPVPSLLVSAAARVESGASNVSLFAFWAVGAAADVAFAAGGHVLAAGAQWLYYRFPRSVIAPLHYANVREDHHLRTHLRWAVALGDRWSLELYLTWVDNASSDARVFDALCARTLSRCADPGDRGSTLASITSYSRYSVTTAEAKVVFRW